MAKTYYKVVRDYRGQLTSCLESFSPSLKIIDRFEIEYKIGDWVKPKVEKTDLMCFSSLADAISFSLTAKHLKIYECNVKNPRTKGIFIPLHDGNFIHYIDLYIDKRIKKQKIYFPKPAYKNVIFCSSIKLLREIC